MKLYYNALHLLAGLLSLASVAGLRASSDDDPLEVFRKLISSSNFDSAAFKESLGSLNSKLIQTHFEKQQGGRDLVTGRECGEVVASVTLAEVNMFLGVYVNALFPDPADTATRQIAASTLLANVKYGFEAVKVCMTCAEAMEVLSDEQLASSAIHSYSSYCSEEKYGYGAEHSALVFLPVDPTTGEVFKATMRAVVSGHGTLIDVEDAPTEFWPSSMTEYLATATANPQNFILATADYLFPLAAAGSGAIVVIPDYIGYGQSVDYNRTYGAAMPYSQSFAMSWLATQKYVASSTEGSSELENVATVHGYSEGGYSALVGTFALQQVGVTILGAFLGGAPLQPILQYASVLKIFADGPPANLFQLFLLKLLVSFTGYASSNEFSFLANTGADQPMLADAFLMPGTPENAIDWFTTGATIERGALAAFVPENVTDMVNPDLNAIFYAAFADGVTDPCTEYVTNTTDKLCQSFQEASLIPLLEQADFNTVLCHDPNDELSSFGNVPSFPFINEMVSLYAGIPVGPNILFQPEGGHYATNIICSISPILYAQSQENGPFLITPTVQLSDAPSGSPTMAPSESSACTNSMLLSTVVLGLMLGAFAI